jgi:glucokinase
MAGWLLGIEIGGTKLQLGIGHGQGTLRALSRVRVEPSAGAAGILAQIKSAFDELLRSANLDRREIEVAGIGFGGPVDSKMGQTITSYQVPGWNQFPLADWARAELGVPRVVLENDSDSAGLAEARFGAGRGLSPVIYTNIGSGIGGALLVDGQLYRGSCRGALEIGHLRVITEPPEGSTARELEHIASGWAIARSAQTETNRLIAEGRANETVLSQAICQSTAITTELVARAAAAGDAVAQRILDRAHEAVAFALTQAITLLAPRRVVMGGGVALIGEAGWLDPIRQRVNRDVLDTFRGQFDIVPASLGEDVVVHGALAVARDALAAARR